MRTPDDHPTLPAGTARLPIISRRSFLKSSSAAVASGGLAAATIGAASVEAQSATPAAEASPMATPSANGTPMAGMNTALPAGQTPVTFFTMHEADTVDALVSRILPGTADDPGAHEAGVVAYIDRQLGGANLGYDLKTYTQGPFLVTSDQPVTVEQSSTRDPYASIPIVADQAARYGYQSVLTPQQLYRRALGFVDAYAQSRFNKNLVELSTDQQDAILQDLATGKATGFDGPSAKAFFTQLRNDTIEGMFCDPMYGGNQNLVGWKLIGYPGAQRNYTPDEIKKGTAKQPQSLMQMMAKEAS